jgi:tRNA(Ile)-lysidine synthase
MAFSPAAVATPAPAADAPGDRPSFELQCRSARIDVAGRVGEQHGANLEQTARELRYGWLSEVVCQEKAAWLATGHTADDQAETVLHRLLRGSGLQGLTAISPRRKLTDSAEVVRPLLHVRRTEIIAYLEAEGQPFRFDSSNADRKFNRNRIRHELLPSLVAQYQPAMVDLLCRLADQAQAVQAEMLTLAHDLLQRTELPRAGPMLVFDIPSLAPASPHLVCEMFRLVWRRENWPMNDMDRQAWLRLDEMVHGTHPQHDFPGHVRARRRGHVLQVGRLS